jgi:hypothetical protein
MSAVTVIVAAIMLFCAQDGAYAQEAVPGEILSRTLLIKKQNREAKKKGQLLP